MLYSDIRKKQGRVHKSEFSYLQRHLSIIILILWSCYKRSSHTFLHMNKLHFPHKLQRTKSSLIRQIRCVATFANNNVWFICSQNVKRWKHNTHLLRLCLWQSIILYLEGKSYTVQPIAYFPARGKTTMQFNNIVLVPVNLQDLASTFTSY